MSVIIPLTLQLVIWHMGLESPKMVIQVRQVYKAFFFPDKKKRCINLSEKDGQEPHEVVEYVPLLFFPIDPDAVDIGRGRRSLLQKVIVAMEKLTTSPVSARSMLKIMTYINTRGTHSISPIIICISCNENSR